MTAHAPASFTALIPARLASTRLPNKPLALIAGLPMVVHVARRAQMSQAARVVVATDSSAVLETCQTHGVAAVLTRADHPSGSDRLAEACDQLGLPDTDIIVNVQGDEPLIDPDLINQVAAMLAGDAAVSMSTAAHPIHVAADFHNPNVVKVVLDARSRASYFSRGSIPYARAGEQGWDATTANAQHPVLRHVGIYGYRAGFLRLFPRLTPAPTEQIEALEQLRALWHGHAIAVHVTNQAPGPGIDTPDDLERVRRLLEAR